MIRYVIYYEDGRKQLLESEKPLKLEMFYKLIETDCIDIVRHVLLTPGMGAAEMTFIVDDNGLLKNRAQNPVIRAFVGTVILTSPDGVQ